VTSIPSDPQLGNPPVSVVLVQRRPLARTGLSEPPLRHLVVKPMEAEDGNVHSVTGAGKNINDEATAASSAAPLEN
jgi:hypothetical protein